MKTYRINARLEERHYAALKRIAKYLDCSLSQVIRATILRYEQQNIPPVAARQKGKQP